MVGERIRKLREWRDYSQCYMATRLGIDQSTYSRIENGRCRPTLDRLQAIADILQVPPENLLRAGPLQVVMHEQMIMARTDGLEQWPTDAILRLLEQNTERARELERMNHRLLDILERRKGDAA